MKFFKGVEFGFWKKFSQISSRKSKGVHQEILRNFPRVNSDFGKVSKGMNSEKKFKGNEFGFWKSCGKKTKSENWSFFDTFWRIAQWVPGVEK